MPTIISTASQDTAFAIYAAKTGDDVEARQVERQILVRGGAGIPDARGMVSAAVETEVTDDELAALRGLKSFTRREDRGFYLVTSSKKEAEKAAADMSAKDGSAMIQTDDLDSAESGEDGTVKVKSGSVRRK